MVSAGRHAWSRGSLHMWRGSVSGTDGASLAPLFRALACIRRIAVGIESVASTPTTRRTFVRKEIRSSMRRMGGFVDLLGDRLFFHDTSLLK